MPRRNESAQNPEAIVRANATRETLASPTFASYYANDTEVQTSPWDVRLILGLITDVNAEEHRAKILQVAEVRMSPQHAKRVLAVMQQQLADYEARFGTIPEPRD